MPTGKAQFAAIDLKLVPPFWMTALALEKIERLADLNLASAKVALEKGVESANALATVRNVEDVNDLRTQLAEAGVQYARAYAKDLYQVLSETQAEFSALLQRSWTSYAEVAQQWVEQSAKAAPVGSELAVDAIKNTLAATNGAIQQISEATQQAGALADEAVRTAMRQPAGRSPKS